MSIMFPTTELPIRVFLTVLPLLLTLNTSSGASVSGGTSDEGSFRAVPLTQASEFRNPTRYYDDSNRRTSSGMSTLVSSGSFNIDPEKAGSSVLISTKPVPFSTVVNNGDHGGFKFALAQKKGEHGNKGGKFNDCFFGKNCPQENPVDDWRTYYSVLNGIDKPFQDQPLNFNHKYGLADEELFPVNGNSAFPFVITGTPHYRNRPFGQNSVYPHEHRRYQDTTRRSRTTTPSSATPSWVKLEPVLPAKIYDPFSLTKGNQSKSASSQFANRVGVELNPESFAERHGWKEGKHGPGGSRLPSWLEDLNYQHGGLNKRPLYDILPTKAPDRDEDKWVKLDAIPVAGVTISKWVPKGTSPAELPSTNWPEQNKPNAWWDRIDNNYESDEPYSTRHSSRPRPPYPIVAAEVPWPSRYPQDSHKHQAQHQHHPSEGWGDVIYPNNNPVSATASWTADKGSSSWANSYNKNKQDSNRYPVASWSAPGSRSPSSSNTNRDNYPYSSHGNARRPSFSVSSGSKPPFYPDPDRLDNDPRWVLVSSSKGPQQSSPPTRPNINYDPDFPYPYQNHHNRHRQSKGMDFTKLLDTSSTTPPVPPLTQDEIFKRTNATLYSLQPVLGQKKLKDPKDDESSISQKLIDIVAQTGANIVASSTESFFTKGRAADLNTPPATKRSDTKRSDKKKSLGGINPVYAAVGAGMIPATLAAVLPMALGRKKRSFEPFANIHLPRPTLREMNPYKEFGAEQADLFNELKPIGLRSLKRVRRSKPSFQSI